MKRKDFDDHIQKVCPKAVVSCPSGNNKCSCKGQRDQTNLHLVDCRFLPMQRIITQLIAENQQLKKLVNQQENAMRKLLEVLEQQKTQIGTHQNENQQLKDLVNQQTVHIGEQQKEIRRLKEQLTQKDSQTTPVSSQSGE